MKSVLLFAFLAVGSLAFAEEKNCTVKGMHCEACQDMVKDRLCEGKGFEVCEVKLPKDAKPKDKENKLGNLHIKTKGKEKIDVAAMNKSLEDTRYTISCQ